MITCGGYITQPITIAWLSNTMGGHYKRSVSVALQVGLGNIGGIIGSFIFQAKESPAYPSGWGTCIGFVVAGAACATILEITYLTINKRRSKLSEEQIRQKYTDDELDKQRLRVGRGRDERFCEWGQVRKENGGTDSHRST